MNRVACLLLAASLTGPIWSQEKSQSPAPKFNWQPGPIEAKLGDQATIDIPQGYMFLDKPELPRFFEATQNFSNGRELGIVAPVDGKWIVIYEFEDIGYVKDDDKDKLDADALYKSMSEAQEAGNEERKRRGWNELNLYGWAEKPHYNPNTNNLEWSIKLGSPGSSLSVNHKTRLLGRRGVMSVELVASESDYAATLPSYRKLNGGFRYTPQNRYSAWVKGDKVAEYGLGALVLGGAAAAAAKTGLFKGLWKLALAFWKVIALALLGLLGVLKNLIFGRKQPVAAEVEPPQAS
ncbi:MAG: DUF2167 domain-containing protein [Bryobacterales bacterium]|nr:DUF2167 domain-containing protein [Bryobacterales bacterium]